jgi:hypothetical protein
VLGRLRLFRYYGIEARMNVSDLISSFIQVLVVNSLFLVLLFAIVSACVADARRRGKSPLLVILAVFFCFPLGLILWLLFRPEPMDGGSHDRRFRLGDHRVQ